MLTMQLPWWEFVLRAAAVYAALHLLLRASGKLTLGDLTPLDLVVVLLLADATSDSLHGSSDALPGGLIAALTLLALEALRGVLARRRRSSGIS